MTVLPAREPASPEPQPRRRRIPRRLAMASLAVIAGAALAGWGLAALLQSLDSSRGDVRALTAGADESWSTVTLLGGGGAIAVDPEWIDVSAYIDLDRMGDSISASLGHEVTVESTLLTSGTTSTGGTVLTVLSATGTASTPAAHEEVGGMLAYIGTTGDAESTVVLDEAPIVTSSGLPGYVSVIEHSLDGAAATQVVAVVTDGTREAIVHVTSKPGEVVDIETWEAVLDSVTFEDE